MTIIDFSNAPWAGIVASIIVLFAFLAFLVCVFSGLLKNHESCYYDKACNFPTAVVVDCKTRGCNYKVQKKQSTSGYCAKCILDQAE